MIIEGIAWRSGKAPNLPMICRNQETFAESALSSLAESAQAQLPLPLSYNFDRSRPPVGEVTGMSLIMGDELHVTAEIFSPALDDERLRELLEDSIRPAMIIRDGYTDDNGIFVVTDARLTEFSICLEPSPLPEKRNET